VTTLSSRRRRSSQRGPKEPLEQINKNQPQRYFSKGLRRLGPEVTIEVATTAA